jgi:Sulfotransferase family
MKMPNCLLIGAARCGTSALCSFLDQHPQIYISPSREPNFFIAEGQGVSPFRGPGDREALERFDMWVSTLERYQSLFADVTTEKAIGEGSTWYLYDERAHQRIYRHIPDARLIAILRNPVDRAYSAYSMLWRDGRETITDFDRALSAEDWRVRAQWEPLWHYRRMGYYFSQLKRYYDTFDPAQIRVVLYDDFNTRPFDVLRDLFRFLEVDEQFTPDVSTRHNVSMVPKHALYHRIVAGRYPLKAVVKAVLPSGFRSRVKRKLVSANLTVPPPLAPDVRRELVDVFRADILQLQALIRRDLSHWLAEAPSGNASSHVPVAI